MKLFICYCIYSADSPYCLCLHFLVGAGNNTQIRKAVEEINKRAHNSEAVFGIHDATNRVMIKIVDKDTKEVLKEYPPEKTLDMIAKVWEVAGLLVDEKM